MENLSFCNSDNKTNCMDANVAATGVHLPVDEKNADVRIEHRNSPKHSMEDDSKPVTVESENTTNNAGYVDKISNEPEANVNNALERNDNFCSESENPKGNDSCDNIDKNSCSVQPIAVIQTNSKNETGFCNAKSNMDEEEIQESLNKLEISGEALKKKSEVIVNSHSESLRSILTYDDISSEEDDEKSGTSESSGTSTESEFSWGSESDSDSGSDSSVIVTSADKDSKNEAIEGTNTGAVKKTTQAGYELQEFLNPVPDVSKLSINVEEEEFLHIGQISSVIAEIVTVTANKLTPAFDIDTLLFIEDETSTKQPLGPIFDVLGPVSEPIYCIRFNTAEEAAKLGLNSGLKVFAAPKSDCTKFVFLKELIKMKGSDASWLNDQEEPVELADYSDDEQEREAKRLNKKKVMKRKYDESRNSHKRYEAMMNQCNIINSRMSSLLDSRNRSDHGRTNISSHMLPCFDPTVPPPGFGMCINPPTAMFSMPLPHFDFNHMQIPPTYMPVSQHRIFPSTHSGNQHQHNTN